MALRIAWERRRTVGITEVIRVTLRMLLARTAEYLSGSHDYRQKIRRHIAVLFFGGDKRIRTAGLLVANEALYQLSHIPMSCLYYKAFLLACQQFFILIF